MRFAIGTQLDPSTVMSKYAQSKLTTSVVQGLTQGTNEGVCLNVKLTAKYVHNSLPYCFIADTNSITVVLDTGANRVIINEKSLLTDFHLSRAQVKGLQGKPITAGGRGRLCMKLESVNRHVEEIDHLAIFCPTSPYNPAPPQLLVRALKQRGYRARAYHDDEEYVIKYSCPGANPHMMRMLISLNDLFLVQMNHG